MLTKRPWPFGKTAGTQPVLSQYKKSYRQRASVALRRDAGSLWIRLHILAVFSPVLSTGPSAHSGTWETLKPGMLRWTLGHRWADFERCRSNFLWQLTFCLVIVYSEASLKAWKLPNLHVVSLSEISSRTRYLSLLSRLGYIILSDASCIIVWCI